MDPCYRKLCATVRDLGLLQPGDHVLVGLSGGPDSVALLLLLLQFRLQQEPTLTLQCCHLNHMLRGKEANEDEDFCKRLCAALDVPCLVGREDVARLARPEARLARREARLARCGGLAGRKGLGTEAAAREARYRFFESAAARTGMSKVALGHQADDNAETLLHRVIRGSGVRGMAGIPAVRPIAPTSSVMVIRPLLRHTAAEIREYLKARGQDWRQDSSNYAVCFTRNRVRHVLLPALEERFHPRIRAMLNRLAEYARVLDDFARQRAREHLSDARVEVGVNGMRFPVAWLRAVPAVLRAEVLHELLERAGVPLGRFAQSHFARLAALGAGEGGARRISLPGYMAERSYDWARVTPRGRDQRDRLSDVLLEVPGVTPLPEFGGQMRVDMENGADFQLASFLRRKGACEEAMDMDRLQEGLHVRAWRPGDRFRPLGARGSKKLQDLFTDVKWPRMDRRRVPIVADAEGIVWVVGLRLGDRAKITSDTRRVLTLRFERP